MTMKIGDYFLSFLQRRCTHPSHMVAVDILEGGATVEVSYCRRCGAVKINWQPNKTKLLAWRLPDPFLWKG